MAFLFQKGILKLEIFLSAVLLRDNSNEDIKQD